MNPLNALLSGTGSQATITPAMIARLNNVWTNVSALGSPALQAAMQAERARFSNFQAFSGMNFNQWAANLQVEVPTRPFFTLLNPRLRGVPEMDFNRLAGWAPGLGRSTNLAGPWQHITNAVMEPIGLGQGRFTDRTGTNSPTLFYQLRVEP